MTVQRKIMRGEIDPSEARQIMAAEARRYSRTLVQIDASMVGDPARLCINPQRSLQVLEQYWSGAERGGMIAYPDRDYADAYWTELSDLEKRELRDALKRFPTHAALMNEAQAHLEDGKIAPTHANIQIAMRLMVRARAQAAREAVEDPLGALLSSEDLASAKPTSCASSAPASAPWLEAPPNSVARSADVVDPFAGIEGDKLATLRMTPVELAKAFIGKKYGFLDHRQGGKRAPTLGKSETRRQILCAARLLQQSVPAGTPFSLITDAQVKTFDSYLDHIPLSFGKAKANHSLDLRLADVVEATTARIADGDDSLTLEDVGLSIPTSNKHFRYLQRLRGLVEELCPTLPRVRFDKYCQADLKGDRDARAEYTVEQGRAIFSLPPWTGCIGIHERLEGGGNIIHDALYWVLLLVWYTGARREEICALHLSNIKEEFGFHFIEVWDGKTINAVRRIPIAAELQRLGFAHYVRAMRDEGEVRLFPEIEPGRMDGKLGDVFYKLWWIYLKPLIPGLIRGQAMHSCRHMVSTELKHLEVFSEHRNDLLGHANGGGEGESRYAKATRLERLQALVDKIPIVTDHLPTLPAYSINLLPQTMRLPRPTRPTADVK